MDGWVVIPGWEKFQHYPDSRGIVWVKDYLDQLDRDEYLALTFAQRGLLLDLRKLYARRRGLVRSDTKTLSRTLSGKVSERQLVALNDAGFIDIVASKPLAVSRERARDLRKEEKKTRARTRGGNPDNPQNVEPADPVEAIETMIRNGVITDTVDLDAEIDGYHLNGELVTHLHNMLKPIP